MFVKKNLKDKEFYELWCDYNKTRDTLLRDKLITHYLYLVKIVVARLSAGMPSYINKDDMYSTGVIGLIRAVEKFDVSRGTRFSSYSSILIKGAIIDEMRSLDWVPRSIHQKANLLGDAQRELSQRLSRDPTNGEIAEYLGINTVYLQELIERIKPVILVSLNDNISSDDNENLLMSERIADPKAKTGCEIAEINEFGRVLKKAVVALPEREKNVLVLYYYENLMLKEIAEVMSVSESRVSQIHTKAIMRLRVRLQTFLCKYYGY